MIALSSRIAALLPRHAFARGVGLLASGTAGSQALLMLAAPLLTRLYTPEQFGLLAVYTGLLSMLLSISTLTYEEAIPLPETDEEGANVAMLCLAIAGLVALACGAVILFADGHILRRLDAAAIAPYIGLLPIGLFLASASQILAFWAMRRKHFSLVAQTRLKQSLANTTMQLAGYKLATLALILGHTAGQTTGCLSLARYARDSAGFRHISLRGMLAAGKRYRNFPLFSTWSNLLNTAGRELPSILLAALFSPAAAGLYALANRVLAMPMTVLGGAIAHVLLANAAQAQREGRLGQLVAAVYDKLSHIAMPFVLMLIVIAPDLFTLAFGQDWRQAGVLVQWMTPWLYIRFIASPFSTLIPVLEKQREGLVFYAIVFVVRIAAILAGSLQHDLVFTVALFSMGSVLCWAAYLIWITVLVGNSSSSLLRPLLKSLGWGGLCMAPLIAGLHAGQMAAWISAALLSVLLICARFYFLLRKAY